MVTTDFVNVTATAEKADDFVLESIKIKASTLPPSAPGFVNKQFGAGNVDEVDAAGNQQHMLLR
jgi:hypothetical protein